MRPSTSRTAAIVVASLALVILVVGCESRETSPPREPEVIVGAGDIADCHSEADTATAKLLATIDGTVVTLGDNTEGKGTIEEFVNCYDPTWGRQKLRTKPVPGNHDYRTPKAEGYFEYFGEAAGDPDKGYYSYEVGSWHVVALNSMCEKVGGCTPNSPQSQWLKKDLADNDKECTLAYFHHPLFTSGRHRRGIPKVKPMWELLYEAGADVVLSSHDENYQRFAPQDPEGNADPERGIRQFVVGTGGGDELYEKLEDPLANSQVENGNTYGVLKLTLHPGSYEWEFVPVEGQTFTDSGRDRCH